MLDYMTLRVIWWLLVGVLLVGEAFSQARLIGFSIIGLALILYSANGLLQARRTAAVGS